MSGLMGRGRFAEAPPAAADPQFLRSRVDRYFAEDERRSVVVGRTPNASITSPSLAAGGVRGGTSENITVGVNWHLTAFTRLTVNYIHSDIDNLSNTSLSEGEVIDALGARLQVEW